jgi:hypothetical protein
VGMTGVGGALTLRSCFLAVPVFPSPFQNHP